MTKSICHIFLGINFVFYFIQSIIKAIQHIFDLISSKIFPFWFLDPIFSNLGEKRPAYQGQGPRSQIPFNTPKCRERCQGWGWAQLSGLTIKCISCRTQGDGGQQRLAQI